MFLRAKDGLYAGEVREFAPEIGRQLLQSGRAENPYAEPAVTVPDVLPVAGTSHVGSTKPAKPGSQQRSR
jgi:hypothetical protein